MLAIYSHKNGFMSYKSWNVIQVRWRFSAPISASLDDFWMISFVLKAQNTSHTQFHI
jgi:hypothetical protein